MWELDQKEQQSETTRSNRNAECNHKEQHNNRKEREHEEHIVRNEDYHHAIVKPAITITKLAIAIATKHDHKEE